MPRNELITIRQTRPPSFMARLIDSVRSYTIGPLTAKSPELARYWGTGPSSSGVSVSEHTAMRYSAVWEAVALISDDVASLPLMLYKRLDSGGKDRFENHPLYELLHDAPNPEMTSFVWRRTMQAHLSLWQNAYAEIERDGAGRPRAIWPLVPELVTKFRQGGLVKYRYQNPSGGEVIYDDVNMLHLVGHSHDGSVGDSLVANARESFGLGLAAERFGGSFFGNGATFGGVIAYKGGRPPEMSDKNYTDMLQARHQGVDRAHKLLALYNDASYTPIGVPPNQAQFLETRVFQIREVARWFKIPPHMLGDLADATFSNVEQMNQAYFGSCLRPLLQLWEQELSRKLIPRLERKIQTIEHVTQGFLSADAAGRSALYTSEFNVGAITPNEVRGFEGLDPITGGDRTFVQLNMIPLDRIDDWIDAQIESATKKPEPNFPPKDDSKDEEVKSLREALELARKAMQMVEDTRDMALAEVSAQKQTVADVSGQRDVLRGTVDERGTELAAAMLRAEAAEQRVRDLAAVCDDLTGKLAASEAGFAALSGSFLAEEEGRKADRLAAAAVLQSERTQAALDTLTAQAASEEAITAVRLQAQAFQQAADIAEAAVREAIGEVQAARVDIAALRVQVEAVTQDNRQIGDDRDAALALASQAETDRDAARQQVAEMVTRANEATQQAADAVIAQQAAQALADAVKAQRDALQADVETLKTDVARARADIASELEAQRTQKATLLAAMRSLFVDASERLLQYESDRARSNQATADKLRAWVDRFYTVHEERVRDAFRPLVGPWTVVAGGAPGALLERLVSEHMTASTEALRRIAEHTEPDVMAGSLERTLRRWEDERADAMADALVREGMGHGQS